MTETKNGWGGDEGSMYKVHMYIRVTGRAVTSLGTLSVVMCRTLIRTDMW